MTSKVIQGHKSSSNFSVNPTLPLMDGPLMLPSQILFLSLSISFSIPLSFSYSLSISLSTSLFCYILKGHMRPLLCRVIFNDFQIFWSNYNLVFFYFSCILSSAFIYKQILIKLSKNTNMKGRKRSFLLCLK